MKAFRQITFRKENSIVWSYTSALILMGVFIMLRPVVAQQDEAIPEMKVEVVEACDELGNPVGLDSVMVWTWNGEQLSQKGLDSAWKAMLNEAGLVLPRNFRPFDMNRHHPAFSMHPFWQWNGEDSSARSYLDELSIGFPEEPFVAEFSEFQDKIMEYRQGCRDLTGLGLKEPSPGVSIDRRNSQ